LSNYFFILIALFGLNINIKQKMILKMNNLVWFLEKISRSLFMKADVVIFLNR